MEMTQTFPWEPTFNKVIITLNRVPEDGELVLSSNTMNTEQYIVAKGTHVHNLSVGDCVMIDIEKLMISKPNPYNTHEEIGQVKIDMIFDDNGNIFGIIEDRYIKARRLTDKPLQTNE